MKKERRAIQRRISVLALFMLIAVGLVVCRYAWLQLVQGSSLGERMKAQVGHDYAIQSPQGTILDRNGR